MPTAAAVPATANPFSDIFPISAAAVAAFDAIFFSALPTASTPLASLLSDIFASFLIFAISSLPMSFSFVTNFPAASRALPKAVFIVCIGCIALSIPAPAMLLSFFTKSDMDYVAVSVSFETSSRPEAADAAANVSFKSDAALLIPSMPLSTDGIFLAISSIKLLAKSFASIRPLLLTSKLI